jgi:hypothetical protein
MLFGTLEARILTRARTFARKASASDVKGKRRLGVQMRPREHKAGGQQQIIDDTLKYAFLRNVIRPSSVRLHPGTDLYRLQRRKMGAKKGGSKGDQEVNSSVRASWPSASQVGVEHA